jgi:membrane-associated phospholipid phosphatase
MSIKTGIPLFIALLAPLLFPGGIVSARAEELFPYSMETGRETGLLLGSSALFAIGWYLDRDSNTFDLEDLAALDHESLNWLDRRATRYWSPGANHFSDILVAGQLISPLGLALGGPGSDEPDRIAAMYAETMALNSGLTYLLKSYFLRSRPLAYNQNPDISRELKTSATARRSFPSGHTANAFASMVFLASVYQESHPDSRDTEWVWAACLASATTTGILRVASGRHFPTDVLAGAVFGTLIGWAVPHLHQFDDPVPGAPAKQAPPIVTLRWGFGF